MGSEQRIQHSYTYKRVRILGATLTLLFFAFFTWLPALNFNRFNGLPGRKITFVDPFSTTSYDHLEAHCSSIPPISQSEFINRQISLAKTLDSLGAAAYIAEPGAYTQFFGNFSKAHWSLSERPLLLVITVNASDHSNKDAHPQVTVLTPKFETTRAKLLPIPSLSGNVKYLEWSEEVSPYATLLSFLDEATSQVKRTTSRKIFVDDSIRKFIVDGIVYASEVKAISSISGVIQKENVDASATDLSHRQQSVQVFSAPPEITQMRECKSEAELHILKCANEATLLAIREVHKNLAPGIQESHARTMISTALQAAGLKNGGCLTLFGENAALPHGSGTDRILTDSDFILFDCTASLHGYWSDVTRTVSLTANSRIPPSHLDTWNIVQKAQQAAITSARNGTVTKAVDASARDVFRNENLEKYFTHRLGHGIGLEVHEAPYLRGGSEDIIQIGHTFSDEPGLYIEGEVGVRLEDCFYIDASGEAVYLTDGVGGPSTKPWLP